MKKDDFNTHIIEVLKERLPSARKKLANYRRTDFSEVYFFFDFDGHAKNLPFNIDNIETLKEMLNVFNNETEFGKLYISYPMIEAYRDLKYGNCQSFRNDCYVYKENFKSYKKDTANNIYTNINKLDYPMWCEIISNYINRIACLFTIKELDRNKFINEITSHTIFNKEKELFTKKGLVFVISALPQFLIDYSKAFWDASLKKRKKPNLVTKCQKKIH